MKNNFLGYNNWMHFSTSKKLIKKKGISSATVYMLTQNVFWKGKNNKQRSTGRYSLCCSKIWKKN